MNNSSIFAPLLKKIDKVLFGFENLEDLDDYEEEYKVSSKSKEAETEEDKVVVRSIN